MGRGTWMFTLTKSERIISARRETRPLAFNALRSLCLQISFQRFALDFLIQSDRTVCLLLFYTSVRSNLESRRPFMRHWLCAKQLIVVSLGSSLLGSRSERSGGRTFGNKKRPCLATGALSMICCVQQPILHGL